MVSIRQEDHSWQRQKQGLGFLLIPRLITRPGLTPGQRPCESHSNPSPRPTSKAADYREEKNEVRERTGWTQGRTKAWKVDEDGMEPIARGCVFGTWGLFITERTCLCRPCWTPEGKNHVGLCVNVLYLKDSGRLLDEGSTIAQLFSECMFLNIFQSSFPTVWGLASTTWFEGANRWGEMRWRVSRSVSGDLGFFFLIFFYFFTKPQKSILS